MTSTILVVDDEPDLETLVQQKFRRRIRDGQVRFRFARDGAEATINKTLLHIETLREARRPQIAAERAHALLSRYFSPNLAERLASDPAAVDLGGQRREITSLFTDMAGFTTIVETLEPDVI